MTQELSPEILRKLLRYEPETGKLFWLHRDVNLFDGDPSSAASRAAGWNTRYAGTEAFTSNLVKGYKCGKIFGKMHRAHRVIWAMHHDAWPKDQIDHVNGDPADNRLQNLRVTNNAENNRNRKRPCSNRTGVVGVCWDKRSGKWRAYITNDYRNLSLGSFESIKDATRERKAAEKRLGFHENHGRG